MREAHQVETLSMRAYPALEEVFEGDLALRAANGYTKRANSARLQRTPVADPARAADACEAFFSARAQPAIFRLLSLNPDAGMDAELDRRGYHLVEPSIVMTCGIEARPTPASAAELRWAEDRTAWSECHARLCAHAPEPAYAEMLRRLDAAPLMAVLSRRGQPVGCGIGVVEAGYVGLFNLVVDPGQRDQGLGTALVRALLDAGEARGASRAYLQVVAENPAVNLYRRLGFADVYRYHYRVLAAKSLD